MNDKNDDDPFDFYTHGNLVCWLFYLYWLQLIKQTYRIFFKVCLKGFPILCKEFIGLFNNLFCLCFELRCYDAVVFPNSAKVAAYGRNSATIFIHPGIRLVIVALNIFFAEYGQPHLLYRILNFFYLLFRFLPFIAFFGVQLLFNAFIYETVSFIFIRIGFNRKLPPINILDYLLYALPISPVR